MDDRLDDMMVRVRADTAGFARDVAAMRAELDGGLSQGAARAGRAIETSLLAAVRSGRVGFDQLKATALAALEEIAAASLRAGLQAVAGGGGGWMAALATGLGQALAGTGGAPGRATGGPVVGGRAYTVGERGPELFVPAGAGRIEPLAVASAREVRVSITVNAPAEAAPAMLMQSGRQVARAVRAALEG